MSINEFRELNEEEAEIDHDEDEELVEQDDVNAVVLGAADLLYEENDRESYGKNFEKKDFREWMVRFLAEELEKVMNNHKLDFNVNEKPADILTATLRLADQMEREGRWPVGIGAKAALRIALKKVLYFGYLKKFELDGVPKNRGFDGSTSGSRKYPSNDEQIRRYRDLEQARNIAKTDRTVAKKLVDLVNQTLLMQMSPEIFNKENFGRIESTQLNDLVINFLLWALDNHPAFLEKQKVVILISLFKSVDRKNVIKDYMKAAKLGEAEKADTECEIDWLYEETVQFFKEEGPQLLTTFLEKIRLDGKDRMKASESGRRTRESSPLSLYLADLKDVEFPKNSWDIILKGSETIMAAHGNLSARNKFAECMLRLIVSLSKHSSYGDVSRIEENIAQANEMIVEKVISYDTRFDYTPATYFHWWIRNNIVNRNYMDRTIPLSPNFRDAIRDYKGLISPAGRYAKLSEQKIEEIFLERYSAETLKRVKNQMYGRTKGSTDDPISATSSRSVGETIADDSEFANISKLIVEKDFAEKLEKVLLLIPPSEAILLRLRHGLHPEADGGLPLQEIGDLFKITKEGVRVIETDIVNKLLGREKYYNRQYRITDQEAWKRFCQTKKWGQLETEIINLAMGWDKATYYRRFNMRNIAEEINRRMQIEISVKEVTTIWRKIRPILLSDKLNDHNTESFLGVISEKEMYRPAQELFRELAPKWSQVEALEAVESEEDDDVKKENEFIPVDFDLNWREIMETVKAFRKPSNRYNRANIRVKKVKPEFSKIKQLISIKLSEKEVKQIASLDETIPGNEVLAMTDLIKTLVEKSILDVVEKVL